MRIPPLIGSGRRVQGGRYGAGRAARHGREEEANVILVIGAGSRTGQALVPLLRAAAVPLPS